jgi:hypothetical protein
MTPKPHKKLDATAVAMVKATSVNLEALYDGGDPFSDDAPVATPAKPAELKEPEVEEEEEDEGEVENPF